MKITIASILMSVLAFLCTMAYLLIFILSAYKYPGANFQLPSVSFFNIAVLLLIPLSAMLGIALVIWTGRKANPVQIAIWGAAVLFLSLPTVIYYLFNISIFFSRYIMTYFTYALKGITAIVSFATGVASCLLALVDYRYQEDVNSSHHPQLRGINPIFVEKGLHNLEKLRRSGRVATEENTNDCVRDCSKGCNRQR